MATDSGRIELYSLLRRNLGADTAAALMEALPPPTDWDDLARRSHVESLYASIGAVEGSVTNVEGRLTNVEGRLTSVEGRLTSVESGFRDVQGGLLDLRAAVIGMQGAIDAQVPKFLRANILTAFAASGLVLAAVKL